MEEKTKKPSQLQSILLIAIFAILSQIGCALTPETNSQTLAPLTEQEVSLVKKLGGEILPDGNIQIGLAKIDRTKMEISFPAELNLTAGDLEVLICIPTGRTHESLLVTDLDPFQLQLALILIGAENGFRSSGSKMTQGTLLTIDVETKKDGRHPIERWLRNKKNGKEREHLEWVFVGSNFTHNGICVAKQEGNIANVWSFGDTIIDNPSEDAFDDDIFEVFSERVPPRKEKLTVYITPIKK